MPPSSTSAARMTAAAAVGGSPLQTAKRDALAAAACAAAASSGQGASAATTTALLPRIVASSSPPAVSVATPNTAGAAPATKTAAAPLQEARAVAGVKTAATACTGSTPARAAIGGFSGCCRTAGGRSNCCCCCSAAGVRSSSCAARAALAGERAYLACSELLSLSLETRRYSSTVFPSSLSLPTVTPKITSTTNTTVTAISATTSTFFCTRSSSNSSSFTGAPFTKHQRSRSTTCNGTKDCICWASRISEDCCCCSSSKLSCCMPCAASRSNLLVGSSSCYCYSRPGSSSGSSRKWRSACLMSSRGRCDGKIRSGSNSNSSGSSSAKASSKPASNRSRCCRCGSSSGGRKTSAARRSRHDGDNSWAAACTRNDSSSSSRTDSSISSRRDNSSARYSGSSRRDSSSSGASSSRRRGVHASGFRNCCSSSSSLHSVTSSSLDRRGSSRTVCRNNNSRSSCNNIKNAYSDSERSRSTNAVDTSAVYILPTRSSSLVSSRNTSTGSSSNSRRSSSMELVNTDTRCCDSAGLRTCCKSRDGRTEQQQHHYFHHSHENSGSKSSACCCCSSSARVETFYKGQDGRFSGKKTKTALQLAECCRGAATSSKEELPHFPIPRWCRKCRWVDLVLPLLLLLAAAAIHNSSGGCAGDVAAHGVETNAASFPLAAALPEALAFFPAFLSYAAAAAATATASATAVAATSAKAAAAAGGNFHFVPAAVVALGAFFNPLAAVSALRLSPSPSPAALLLFPTQLRDKSNSVGGRRAGAAGAAGTGAAVYPLEGAAGLGKSRGKGTRGTQGKEATRRATEDRPAAATATAAGGGAAAVLTEEEGAANMAAGQGDSVGEAGGAAVLGERTTQQHACLKENSISGIGMKQQPQHIFARATANSFITVGSSGSSHPRAAAANSASRHAPAFLAAARSALVGLDDSNSSSSGSRKGKGDFCCSSTFTCASSNNNSSICITENTSGKPLVLRVAAGKRNTSLGAYDGEVEFPRSCAPAAPFAAARASRGQRARPPFSCSAAAALPSATEVPQPPQRHQPPLQQLVWKEEEREKQQRQQGSACVRVPAGVGCRLVGVGSAIPQGCLTNDDLRQSVDTSDEWIRTRTGIQERRVLLENESLRQLSVLAAQRALLHHRQQQQHLNNCSISSSSSERASAAAVDLVLQASSSPDDLFGDGTSVAAALTQPYNAAVAGASGAQEKEEGGAAAARDAVAAEAGEAAAAARLREEGEDLQQLQQQSCPAAFDITAACSGFLVGLITANSFLSTPYSSPYNRVLLVGADALSRWVDWNDRNTCVLFGDAAGAVVLQRQQQQMQWRGGKETETETAANDQQKETEGKPKEANENKSLLKERGPQTRGIGEAQNGKEEGKKREREGEQEGKPLGLLSYVLNSDGLQASQLTLSFSGRLHSIARAGNEKPLLLRSGAYKQLEMNGREVFRFVSKCVPAAVEEVVAAAGLRVEEIDWLLLHQANKRIIDAVAQRLQLPPHKVLCNLEKYGNTSAASIPLCLDEAVREGKVKRGDVIVMAGFGAGLTWSAAVLRYG